MAAVRPRGKSVPRLTTTVPVTPNVLKKRKMPRLMPFKHEQPQYIFKAKPAPVIHKQHKSCGNLNKIPNYAVKTLTKDLDKMTLTKTVVPATLPTVKRTLTTQNNKENSGPTKSSSTATTITQVRKSRMPTRPTTSSAVTADPKPRSSSVPGRYTRPTATVPVTPMVLKRKPSKTVTAAAFSKKTEEVYQFKAKPAPGVNRKPFKPKLTTNQQDAPAVIKDPSKPFEFCLEDRIKERKQFNHRSTDTLEKKTKQV